MKILWQTPAYPIVGHCPNWHRLPQPSWLPYSTDSDFHDFAFVFVSWVGGGNPPLAEAECLGLHCGQKKARQGWFLFKIGFLCAWKGSNCKIYDIKGLKTHQNCSFFTMAVQLANWGADTFSFFGGIFGQPSFLETCSVDSQLNSDRFSFFYFLDWTSESRETKFLVRRLRLILAVKIMDNHRHRQSESSD